MPRGGGPRSALRPPEHSLPFSSEPGILPFCRRQAGARDPRARARAPGRHRSGTPGRHEPGVVAGTAHGLGDRGPRLPGEATPLRGRAPLPSVEPGGSGSCPAVLPNRVSRCCAARLGDGPVGPLSARPLSRGPGGRVCDGRPLHCGCDTGRGAPAPAGPRERGNLLHNRSPRRSHPVGCRGGRIPGPVSRGPRDASGFARVGGPASGPPPEPLSQALGTHGPLRAGCSRSNI